MKQTAEAGPMQELEKVEEQGVAPVGQTSGETGFKGAPRRWQVPGYHAESVVPLRWCLGVIPALEPGPHHLPAVDTSFAVPQQEVNGAPRRCSSGGSKCQLTRCVLLVYQVEDVYGI